MIDSVPAETQVWDTTYRNAGLSRLWPQDPTISKLNLEAWRSGGVNVVLDAGCGDGKNLVHLAREGFFVVGADASVAALDKCRQYLGDHELRGRSLLLAATPLDQLPLCDEAVDAVLCIDVLGHLREPLPVFRELRRVLRGGGTLYASIFDVADSCRTGPRMQPISNQEEYVYVASNEAQENYYFRFYKEEEARRLFESSGLCFESMETHRWHEPPHVGYRNEAHDHQSWFALLRKT